MQELHKSLTQKSKSYKKWHKFSGHETYHWLILAVLVIFAGLVITNKAEFLFGEAARPDVEQTQELGAQIPELTKQMINLARDLRKALPEEREEILAELVTIAEQRKALVGQAVKENPRVAVNNAFNNQLKAQMPQEVRDLIEEKKTIRGTFEAAIGEDLERGVEHHFFFLKERGSEKRYSINFPKDTTPQANAGDEIALAGVVSGEEIAATTEELTVLQGDAVVADSQKKIAVIIFKFRNTSSAPMTVDSARQKYFTGTPSANSYYTESSYGKLGLTGDVFGVYTIPYDSSSCSSSMFQTWGAAADKEAQQAGVSLSGYDYKSYVFPRAGCGYVGYAWTGGSSYIMTGELWAVTHELGHVIGAAHASLGKSCTTGTNPVTFNSTCNLGDSYNAYGDDYYTMGNHSTWHISGYMKGKGGNFGWLQSANKFTVDRRLQPDNVYTVVPLETASTGIQSLRVQKDSDEYYYLEFRQPIGLDAVKTDNSQEVDLATAYSGVIVRLAHDYTGSYYSENGARFDSRLLDMTPSSSLGIRDAALTVGNTFRDAAVDMNITVQSVSSEGAKVRVWFGSAPTTCAKADPGISVTPSSNTGLAGTALSYTVKVTNRDSSVCGDSAFSVSSTLPAGFLQTPVSFITPQIAPGGSYSQNVLITSPDAAAEGTYTITQRATNTAATAYTSTITASYVISTADTEAPQVTITAPADGATVTGMATISADITDNIGVTKSAFLIDGNGIGTDSTAPYSMQWDSSTVAAGSHKIVVKARDAAGNVRSSSITVTTSSTTSGDTETPQVTLTSPADGSTVSGTVSIAATASDNIGVTQVIFRVDGTNIGTDQTAPYAMNWDSSSVSNGSHNIVAVAQDAAGNTSNASATVTAANTQTGDTTAPLVTIQNPANSSNISNGQNNVDVSATDNVRVSKIDILLDGNIVGTCTGTAETLACGARFLGNKESNGAHFILVRAYDQAGNIGTRQISVTK